MKLKNGISLLLATIMTFSSLNFVLANENETEAIFNPKIENSDGMGVSSGTISSSTGFGPTSWILSSSNGKYVNFYIENIGEVDIMAKINGDSERIFKPGEKGHIYIEVVDGLLVNYKNYEFKAVSAKNGGTVEMNYIIAQRNSQ